MSVQDVDINFDRRYWDVPNLETWYATRPCGLSAISLYSGVGGADLGFARAGIPVSWSHVDREEWRRTYGYNNVNEAYLDPRRIWDVEFDEVRDFLGRDLDILLATPFESEIVESENFALRVCEAAYRLKPKMIVVIARKRLVSGAKNIKISTKLGDSLAANGYAVEAILVDTSDLFAPRRSEYVIFFAAGPGLTLPDIAPLEFHISVRRALPHINTLIYEPPREMLGIGEERGQSIEGTRIGRMWPHVKIGDYHTSRFNLRKIDPELPCPPLTRQGGEKGAADAILPVKPQKFSIPELRRICSFPDNFRISGVYASKWEQLVMSVPPMAAWYIAEQVRRSFERLGERNSEKEEASQTG